MHVRQSVIAAAVAESEPLVVHAEQMQNRGVEVVDVAFIFGDIDSVLIALAVRDAALAVSVSFL